jgi:hypothetical protein
MHKNGISNNAGASTAPEADSAEVDAIRKELGRLRTQVAEIASTVRTTYGAESPASKLVKEVSASIQRLEAHVSGCLSARIE